MSTLSDWAIFYAEKGLPVVPLNGKLPFVSWAKYQDICPTVQEVTKWWQQFPTANIGLITGETYNRLVVDVDGAEGQKYIDSLSINVETLVVKTRRGRQYHFEFPNGIKAKTTVAGLVPEVDVRGSGGLVLLPPSLCSDGVSRYAFISPLDTPLVSTPQEIQYLLIEKSKPRVVERVSGESWLQEKLNELKEGNRNATFTSIAGSLRSRGYAGGDIYTILEPHAITAKFDLSELETICNSVGSYAPKEPAQNESVFTFSTDADKYLAELAERSKHLEPEFCTGFPSLDRLTKGFPRQNIYVIGAPTNGGKTQFVLANILALLKKGKRVLYFSTEMPQNEIKDRFNAIGARIPIEELTSGFLKASSRERLVKFLTSFDSSQFIIAPEDTPTLETITNALEKVRPDIVVLDHIHHIKVSGDNRRTAIDDFVMGFKKLVLQYNIPGIVTSQLRRKDSLDGKPVQYTMHDFKESGGIENEAGVCLLLCPPNEWTSDRIQHVTGYLPKNRHGRREVRFSLEFDTETASFNEPGDLYASQ